MRPLTVLTGIILGSAGSIAFSLAAVLLMFAIHSDEYPRLAREYDVLVRSLLLFTALTAVSAASFYSLLKNRRYWQAWQAATWVLVAVIAYSFAP